MDPWTVERASSAQVPKQYHTLFVGPGGKHVRRIETETGATVDIPKDSHASDAIRVSGSAESVKKARNYIEDKLHDYRQARSLHDQPKVAKDADDANKSIGRETMSPLRSQKIECGPIKRRRGRSNDRYRSVVRGSHSRSGGRIRDQGRSVRGRDQSRKNHSRQRRQRVSRSWSRSRRLQRSRSWSRSRSHSQTRSHSRSRSRSQSRSQSQSQSPHIPSQPNRCHQR